MTNRAAAPCHVEADEQAFACVSLAWQAHEGELRGFLRHRLPDTDAADDLLQDVFLKALRAGQGFCSLDWKSVV